MKNYINSLAVILTLASLASCKKDLPAEPQIPDDLKNQISFSMSDESAAGTKAGFTGSATNIAMRIQSNEKGGAGVKYTRTVASASKDTNGGDDDYSEVTFDGAYKRYWDDAFGRKALLSVFAVAVPNGDNTIKNPLSGGTPKSLEDLLSPGDASATWGANATNTIAWTVTTSAQTKDASTAVAPGNTIDKEDLVYANNIQADGTLGKDGIYRWNYTSNKYMPEATGATSHGDGQMLFFQNGMTDPKNDEISSAAGHFDRGHLKFQHALSRMTINIVKDASFNDKPFKFTDGTNITLIDMNVKGTLDLPTGVWTVSPKADGGIANIVKIAKTTAETTADGTYTSQMLPGYTFTNGSSTNVMEFTIDGNTYYVTQDMLFDALTYDKDNDGVYDSADGDGQLVGVTDPIVMEQGKNYVFTITVKKTVIEKITATLAPWVDVTAHEFGLDNSHVEFTLKKVTGDACPIDNINLLKLTEDLGKIYTDASYITDGKGKKFKGNYIPDATLANNIADLTDMTGGKFSTNWYFEDNKTAYHFRTLSDNAIASPVFASSPSTYFTMTGAGVATLPDYHWGAPMYSTANLAYDTDADKGYVANIHPGLTSTHSDINITEMHMLANLYITLETTTGTDKVDLSGATIKLTKLSNEAQVEIGNGYINPGKTVESVFTAGAVVDEVTMFQPSTYWETENVKTKAFQYAVIPQALVRGTGSSDNDYVGITITTSDNNQYYVIRKLSEIYAESTKIDDTAYTDPDQATASDSSSASDKEKARIVRWYPNHNYHYNIKITKNQIDHITCTVAKWVDVNAANTDITLED